jgi:hypothetical protein
MTERLTTLTQVKDYLEIQTDESDSFLTRLIDQPLSSSSPGSDAIPSVFDPTPRTSEARVAPP